MQPARSGDSASPEAEQLLYTPDEAASLVAVTAHWLISRARKGEIPHHRLGKLYRFGREDLEAIKQMHAQPVGKKGRRSRRGE